MSTQSIVILGASFAGIGACHWALRHVIPNLENLEQADSNYNVILINPSKEFYWRFAAPRACVSKELMPTEKIFFPIEPAFEYASDTFRFLQGSATRVNPHEQTVSISLASGRLVSVSYMALVVATGFDTPCPLFTQTSDAEALSLLYDDFQESLATAKTIVIGGGGPVAVETAGEIAEWLNGRPGFMASGPKRSRASITLICDDKKLLPVLRKSIGKSAQEQLNKLGCDVLCNTRVETVIDEDACTRVELSDGRVFKADLYVDATGIRPNTNFLPQEWLNHRNRLACHPHTLRVEHQSARGRVYAIGDVGSYTRGGVADLYNAIPVAMTNLRTDLIACITGVVTAGDRLYTPSLKEEQICPIGTQKGVGALNGFRVPSMVVNRIKGKDYQLSQLAEATLRGDQYKKEGYWIPVYEDDIETSSFASNSSSFD